MWQKVKVQLMLSMSFLAAVFWYCRRLYSFLAQLLKWWSSYLQRKLLRNLSVLTEVDLLGYSAREWKGETKQAKHMREAYEELFWSCHIKYLRQVRRDNYSVVRAVLFQIFSHGIPFPSWMKERDILKLPEKLLYSQGCNWIQQYSFGPERYTGPNAFGKLRKCMEALKTNWAEISATKDHEQRGNMCNTLFSDESKEHKLYEAIKFIMLYEVVEAYEQIKNREEPVHSLFSLLFARDSSSDPLSFMMNHLNSIGDSVCLDQVDLSLLGYVLEVKIRVYRLHRFNTEVFQVNYPAQYRREWNEISLLTEDDRYYHIPLFRTLTKPLSFADCVGDELPWGWEAAYDPQIGVYYIDHINQTTQIEDPRKQWRKEQERMLKDYLTIAQDALSTQKELYLVKEQRLALALDEYVRLNGAYKEKSSSRTSLFSGSSSNTKYDPDILKAEIATTRLRVKKLKRELSQMKQELLYKEQGFETLQQIDQKMSGGQSGYELCEAKAILRELKSIRKAISSGEREKQDLMKSLAKLREKFNFDQSIETSEPDLSSSSVNSQLCFPRQTLDTGSQTDISCEIGPRSRSNLAEKVRLSLQYEEAKRSMANLKIELSKLDSETWPGALDVEKEKLMLINEKEELLKELQFITPCKRTQDELEQLEAERKKLEEELVSVKSTPSQALAERLKLEERRKELIEKLEETTKLTTYLHSQLRSLSASTLSVSSGSSLGSLASSRGSLNTSSRGSLNSLSSTDLYYNQGDQITDLDYQYKLDFILQEKCGYIPSGPITTIHENEVVSSHGRLGYSDSPSAADHPKLTEPPKSVTSLSSRSSLSSLSPPGSPLVLETAYSVSAQNSPPHHLTTDFEDSDLLGDFAGISLCENQILLDSEARAGSQIPRGGKDLNEGIRQPLPSLHEGSSGVDLPRRTASHLLEEKTDCVSAAVSDESVAGDSGVYEASVKQTNETGDIVYSEDDATILEAAQVQIGLRYDHDSSSFVIIIVRLRNFPAISAPLGSKVYIRVALLPSSTDISCLFRTKVHPAMETVLFKEIFRIAISQVTLLQKMLRVDVCTVSRNHREECLAGTEISLADLSFSDETCTLWYNLMPCKQIPGKKPKEQNDEYTFLLSKQSLDSLDLDAVSALLERTSAELEAVEQELAEDEEEEQEQRSSEEDWLEMLAEASDEIVDEEEDGIKLAVEGSCPHDMGLLTSAPETTEDKDREHTDEAHENQQAAVILTLVDKETNTEESVDENTPVRPKDRASRSSRQRPFVRNSMIVRSQTFSPGERNQYICRLNRSDSDSSTLAKKSLFVRNATERQSLRVKRPVCQPVMRRATQECPTRTSLDLELDLQASRTRQSRLNDELQALRDLKQKLEEMKGRGESDFPLYVLEDERFQKLLKQAEKQAEQSKEEQKQGLSAEKLMRKASKDVCRLREQSQKVPLQVQSFREKIAYFTRAKISVPALPADDV